MLTERLKWKETRFSRFFIIFYKQAKVKQQQQYQSNKPTNPPPSLKEKPHI